MRENGAQTPPDYLRDAHYPGAEALGRGHRLPVRPRSARRRRRPAVLPEGLADRRFYEPTGNGREKAFGERLAELRKRLGNP